MICSAIILNWGGFNMAQKLHATFNRIVDVERVVEALKRQNVLDLHVEPVPVNKASLSEVLSSVSLTSASLEVPKQPDIGELTPTRTSSETLIYTIQVFVESSRYRQAEDTISQHGGHL
jgi:hypothetical protein